ILPDAKNPPQATPEATKKAEPHRGNDSASDPLTTALMAIETSVWEAWAAKDLNKLDALTAKDLSFQNIYGNFFSNKADTLRDWTSSRCQVTKVGVTDGTATALSPTVGILIRTGSAQGTCDGQNLRAVAIPGASFFVREGGAWKLAFTLNRLPE